jgi:hypothetical protein
MPGSLLVGALQEPKIRRLKNALVLHLRLTVDNYLYHIR